MPGLGGGEWAYGLQRGPRHVDHAAARVGRVDLRPQAIGDGHLRVAAHPVLAQARRVRRVLRSLRQGSRLPRLVIEHLLRLLRLLRLLLRLLRLLRLLLRLLRLLRLRPLFGLARLRELVVLRGAHLVRVRG